MTFAIVDLKECARLTKIADIISHQSQIFFVYTNCQSMLLQDVDKQGQLPEGKAAFYLEQIIKIYDTLFTQYKCAPKDITIWNVFLNNDQVLIGDYGLMNYLYTNKKYQSYTISFPPEIMGQNQWSHEKSDVWNLGIIFYKMLFGALPLKELMLSPDKLLSELKSHGQVPIPQSQFKQSYLSWEAQDLLSKMLCVNPHFRISFSDLLKHSLFAGRQQKMQQILQDRNQEEAQYLKSIINLFHGQEKYSSPYPDLLDSKNPLSHSLGN